MSKELSAVTFFQSVTIKCVKKLGHSKEAFNTVDDNVIKGVMLALENGIVSVSHEKFDNVHYVPLANVRNFAIRCK